MAFSFFLFLVYFAVCAIWVLRSHAARETGLHPGIIGILYTLKIGAGLAIGWYTQAYAPGNDYWTLHRDSIPEYELLIRDPLRFITSLADSPYPNRGGYFDSVGSYWNDLKNNLIIKCLAVCNLLSRGNYYINSLFFNTGCFFGLLSLYRFFQTYYAPKKWALITGVFLIPSTLYFGSGIYKDLIVLACLGFFLHALEKCTRKGAGLQAWLILIISWTGILFIRNYVAVILLPLAIYAWAYVKFTAYKKQVLIIALLTGLMGLLSLQWIPDAYQPLQILIKKQQDFAALPGTQTDIPVPQLNENPVSFFYHLPAAINHAFFRPRISDAQEPLLIPFILELWGLYLLAIASCIRRDQAVSLRHPMIIMLLLFSILLLILTGFIIPNLGSLVRYRSIYLPLLFTPLLAQLRWGKSNS